MEGEINQNMKLIIMTANLPSIIYDEQYVTWIRRTWGEDHNRYYYE